MVKAFRQKILAFGGEFRFQCRVEDVELRDGRVAFADTNASEPLAGTHGDPTAARRENDLAEATTDREMADAMSQAADGLEEISGQIETYEDVTNAPEWMSSGEFAEGGERISNLCAG